MEPAPSVVPDFAWPEMHQRSFSHGSSRQFENKKKCCRFCKRHVETTESTFYDTEDETNFRTHIQAHNLQSKNPFLTADTNRLALALRPESGREEPERKRNIDDYRLKDIGLLVAALNRLTTALVKQEGPREPNALCKEAFDAIKRAESCLLGLQTGSNRYTVRDTITESIIQEELFNVVSSFDPDTMSVKALVIPRSVSSRIPQICLTRLQTRALPRDDHKRSVVTNKQPRQSRRPNQANDSDHNSNYRTSMARNKVQFQSSMSTRRRKMLHHTNTNSRSSNSKSQENSSSTSYYTERFNTPIHKPRRKYITSSTTSSESIRYTPRRSHRYAKDKETSSSSRASHGDYELTSRSPSYESEEYSLPSSPRSDQEFSTTGTKYNSTLDRKGPTTRNHKDGAWKKLKDKLAIIFHHHHHHHHHHRHRRNHPTTTSEEDNDPNNHRIKDGNGVKKVEKSIINGVGVRKHEQKKVGDLVGGLFNHIKKKKKSKTSVASNLKRLERSKHGGGGGKNVLKKKQWWQKKHAKRLGFGHKNKMALL